MRLNEVFKYDFPVYAIQIMVSGHVHDKEGFIDVRNKGRMRVGYYKEMATLTDINAIQDLMIFPEDKPTPQPTLYENKADVIKDAKIIQRICDCILRPNYLNIEKRQIEFFVKPVVWKASKK